MTKSDKKTTLTEKCIDVDKIKEGIFKYLKIKGMYEKGRNSIDETEFQRIYCDFYKINAIRPSKEWKAKYFALMKKYYDKKDTSFATILKEAPKSGKNCSSMPFSFASKLLHTINNDKHIWDSRVLKYYKLPLRPTGNIGDDVRIAKANEIYEEIYKKHLENMKSYIALFDKLFKDVPGVDKISKMKKIDFIIWGQKD